MRKVKVTIANEEYEYEAGIMYEQIAKDFQKDYEAKIVLVSADGRLRELHKILSNDCTIEFITLADKIGMETYRRSATFLLVKAVHDVLGDDGKNHLVAQYTVGRGLLCKLIDAKPTEQFLRSVHARMDELISQNIPIWKSSYSVEEARRIFAEAGMEDKVKLFKFRRASKVNVYSIGDYKDYYYGYMVPSTGYITHYDLYPYDEGIILQLPSRHSPNVVPDKTESPKLQKTLQNTSNWGSSIGIEDVGDLNETICAEGVQDVVLLQEAYMESKIAQIAKDIVDKGGKKFIMIAGPSSSGKTSFSYRLSIQLRALGMRPHPIALDNYFKNREDTPKDENGDYDFECLEAIDIEQFNNDMLALLAGQTVELPSFNFKT